MSLIPPKRLFNISTLSTVMYKDVADDVAEKGYAAISHVWGNQTKYSANMFGIVGVDWEIPLSDSNIFRLKNAMIEYGMEYCWFDVLCMPQDKQDEINLEIPYMGDYYSGARLTLVLSDKTYIMTEEFTKWYDMMSDIMESERKFTLDEEQWIAEKKRNLMDFSSDLWFTRVWTLQEAVLSKKIIFASVNGNYLNLSNIITKLGAMSSQKMIHGHFLFTDSRMFLLGLVNAIEEHKTNELNLTRILGLSVERNCFKSQDKFYGTLGILGYKDFVVDYEIDIDSLNKLIVQYASFKGDLSWLAVGGNFGTGFIQPIYKTFPYIGLYWKEEILGVCEVAFQDNIIHMKTMKFGVVKRHEKFLGSSKDLQEIIRWTATIFKGWGFNHADILDAMMGYVGVPYEAIEMGGQYLDMIISGMSQEHILLLFSQRFSFQLIHKYLVDIISKISLTGRMYETVTIVDANIFKVNQRCPLIVCGDVHTGDTIVSPRIYDAAKRNLGIVVSSVFGRKGVCYLPQRKMSEERKLVNFVSCEFPL